jgi:type I restriction enzyme, S subunit
MEGYKKTIIGNIPIDWNLAKLKDVADFSNGKGHEKNIVDDGAFIVVNSKFISTNGMVKKFSDKNLSPLVKNDIAIVMSDIPNGKAIAKCFLVDKDNTYTLNQRIGSLRAHKNVDFKFLYSVLNRNSYYLAFDNGVGQTNLRKDEVLNCPVQLPPLPEQQKIADILSTVDEKIEVINQQIGETEELKKGLMQRLLTKGIGHTEFKDSPLGEIPKSWEIVPIFELRNKEDRYSFTGGPFGSDLKSEHYTLSGVKVLQLQNIGEGKFIDKGLVYTTEEKANELFSCNIYPNDIILAKMAPVARCCKVPSTDKRYLMCSDGIRLSVDTKRFDSEFVYQALNSTYFRKEAESKSTGTTRARIGLNDLKVIPILIPKNIDEQKKIGKTLKFIDDKTEIQIEKKMQYLQLKKGLMQQLLTGKIRVNNLIEA